MGFSLLVYHQVGVDKELGIGQTVVVCGYTMSSFDMAIASVSYTNQCQKGLQSQLYCPHLQYIDVLG